MRGTRPRRARRPTQVKGASRAGGSPSASASATRRGCARVVPATRGPAGSCDGALPRRLRHIDYKGPVPAVAVPVVVAALGGAMCASPGHAADGAMPYVVTVESVAAARRTLDDTAAAAGRPRPRLIVMVPVVPDRRPGGRRARGSQGPRGVLGTSRLRPQAPVRPGVRGGGLRLARRADGRNPRPRGSHSGRVRAWARVSARSPRRGGRDRDRADAARTGRRVLFEAVRRGQLPGGGRSPRHGPPMTPHPPLELALTLGGGGRGTTTAVARTAEAGGFSRLWLFDGAGHGANRTRS